MGQVIELCNRCGFEIPSDAALCPGCRVGAESTSLASRLVVGEALPSRSVHPLHTVAPRRERAAVSAGEGDGALAAFGYASLLIGVALLGLVLGWIVNLQRFVLDVPVGLADRIHQLTLVATWASVTALALGLGALAARELRRIAVSAFEHLPPHDPGA